MKTIMIIVVLFLPLGITYSNGNDTLKVNNNLFSIKYATIKLEKQDSIFFKMPKYIQGKFCDFEDKIQKKKVPLDFSLGKNKY